MNWLPLLAEPSTPLREAVAIFERDYLRAAIEKCGGNLRETARLMQIGYSTLKTKVAQFDPDWRARRRGAP